MIKKSWKAVRASSKGQIKMFETIAVLIIFFFLIVFGLAFYGMMSAKGFQRESERLLQLEAVGLAQKVSFMSELDCSQTAIQKENCFDKYKIEAFAGMLNSSIDAQDYYFFSFGYATIKLRQIFPEERSYVIYEKPKKRWTTQLLTPIPIVIFDETASRLGTYSFGVLEVITYA